jgi:long-chain acyl-CoA synthetase
MTASKEQGMDNLAATGGVTGPGRIGRVAIGDLLKRAARRFPDRVALTEREVTMTLGGVSGDGNG